MRKLLLRMKNDRMSPVMMVVVGVMAGVHCAEQIELTGENVCTTKVRSFGSNQSNCSSCCCSAGSGIQTGQRLLSAVSPDQEALAVSDPALHLLGLRQHHEAPVAAGQHHPDCDPQAVLPGIQRDGGCEVRA